MNPNQIKTALGSPSGSAIVWAGPSRFRPSELVYAVAVSIAPKRRGANPKTGDCIQVWTVPAERDPVGAVKTGDDFVVCGDCPLRFPRCCYVNVGMARMIWRACEEGTIPMLTDDRLLEEVFEGRTVRLGAYGDPYALPPHVVRGLCDVGERHLGYTQQWRLGSRARHLRHLCVASVHTPAHQKVAHRMGWRTFRTRLQGEGLLPGEVMCPGSAEARTDRRRRKVTCEQCRRCDGARHPDDRRRCGAAFPHGWHSGNYARVREAMRL